MVSCTALRRQDRAMVRIKGCGMQWFSLPEWGRLGATTVHQSDAWYLLARKGPVSSEPDSLCKQQDLASQVLSCPGPADPMLASSYQQPLIWHSRSWSWYWVSVIGLWWERRILDFPFPIFSFIPETDTAEDRSVLLKKKPRYAISLSLSHTHTHTHTHAHTHTHTHTRTHMHYASIHVRTLTYARTLSFVCFYSYIFVFF